MLIFPAGYIKKENGLVIEKLNLALTLICDYMVKLSSGGVIVMDLLLHHERSFITI